MSLSWPEQAIKRLELLRRWREFSNVVARAAKEVLRDRLVGVYVVGSVVEGKATVFSDIDVVIITSDLKLKSLDTIVNIKLRAEDLGLPVEAPTDIKILTEEEFKEALGKLYRKAVKVEI